MGQINDSYGNTITRQGDTFYIYLTLTQEETEKRGTLYMQVINEKRKQMFPEEVTEPVRPGVTEVTMTVDAARSDLLTVPKSQDSEKYKFAIKWCSSTGIEDTWIIGGMEFDELPEIEVFPKVVNGGIGTDVEDVDDENNEENTISGGNDTTPSEDNDTTPGGNDSINGGE